jgi:hypothetical protein
VLAIDITRNKALGPLTKIEEQLPGGGFFVLMDCRRRLELLVASGHLQMNTRFRVMSANFEGLGACTQNWGTETILLAVAVVLEG